MKGHRIRGCTQALSVALHRLINRESMRCTFVADFHPLIRYVESGVNVS